MANVIDYIPELEGDEAAYIGKMMQSMDASRAERFSRAYRARRKDPTMILLTALVGFLGVAGVHRFLVNQIGMGLLYVFTGGLCLIGTIVDLVNYKNLAFDYNREIALDVYELLRES